MSEARSSVTPAASPIGESRCKEDGAPTRDLRRDRPVRGLPATGGYDPESPATAGVSSNREPAVTGVTGHHPAPCVAGVWSRWCLLRHDRPFSARMPSRPHLAFVSLVGVPEQAGRAAGGDGARLGSTRTPRSVSACAGSRASRPSRRLSENGIRRPIGLPAALPIAPERSARCFAAASDSSSASAARCWRRT